MPVRLPAAPVPSRVVWLATFSCHVTLSVLTISDQVTCKPMHWCKGRSEQYVGTQGHRSWEASNKSCRDSIFGPNCPIWTFFGSSKIFFNISDSILTLLEVNGASTSDLSIFIVLECIF